jgi:peptidyl-prolyl cis-trans isomerase A (cyclophilin A)
MDPFHVEFKLAGQGVPDGASFLLKVEPSWAPIGAARFRDLVDAKFYDDNRFFRVLDGDYKIWIAQFGIHGDPATHRVWEKKAIKDDPSTHSNKRGTVSFAMSGPNSRTSQLFLNFGDSGPVLDKDFPVFGEVVRGMAAVDAIYKIGEGPPSGKGPSQRDITTKGNAYLDAKFPQLTRVLTARVVAAPDREL